MQALPGISILIGIRLPQSISLNILQFLTNTHNEWWQMSVFWVELKYIATKAERWEPGSVLRPSLPLLLLPPALCPPDCRRSHNCNGRNGPGIMILETQELSPNSGKQKENKQRVIWTLHVSMTIHYHSTGDMHARLPHKSDGNEVYLKLRLFQTHQGTYPFKGSFGRRNYIVSHPFAKWIQVYSPLREPNLQIQLNRASVRW